MKTKTVGYIVVDKCDDWEQPLSLRFGPHLPIGGILSWDKHVWLFPSRQAAREAITRTDHYRQALNMQLPEKRFCKIMPVKGEQDAE